MYKLFGSVNVASFAPHVCLVKAGVDFEFINVDMKNKEQHSKSYKKLNPNGRVPVLVDESIGDEPLVLYETAAICLHISEHCREANLFPTIGTRERSNAYKWLIYMTNTLQSELMTFHYADRYTSDLAAIPANKKQMSIRIADTMRILANEFEYGQEFLTGNEPNLCDYYLFMLAEWTHDFGIPNGPMSYPKLASYLHKLKGLPEIQETMKREGFTSSF